MGKKKIKINLSYDEDLEEDLDGYETPPNAEQKLYVLLDKNQRGGKKVTLVEGFEGLEEDAVELNKKLKKLCGAGGSAKNGEIIVQGDFREKVLEYLLNKGYTAKRKGW